MNIRTAQATCRTTFFTQSKKKYLRNIKSRLAENMEVVLNRNYPIFSSKLRKRVILNIKFIFKGMLKVFGIFA